MSGIKGTSSSYGVRLIVRVVAPPWERIPLKKSELSPAQIKSSLIKVNYSKTLQYIYTYMGYLDNNNHYQLIQNQSYLS